MSQAIKILRNSLLLHNRSGFTRRASNTLSKEVIPASTDLLLTNLRNARSVHNVFDLVSSHHLIMNNRHSMQALRSLFALQKNNRGEISTQEILKHRDFEKLCGQLRKQAGVIELRDTIDALKVLTYVGVPSDTQICQVLLQLVRYSVNQMSLAQIIFVDFLLKRLKPIPLVDALQIALPIVFEAQLPVKMDTSKVAHLAEYWYYISRKNVSDKCVELLINALLLNGEEWDAKTAVSLLWSTCDLRPNWRFKPLIERSIHSVMNNMDGISYEDLDTALSKLAQRYNNKMTFYYSEEFFDACGTFVVERDLGFEHAIYTQKKFLRLNHVHDELLDYISEICLQNPDLIANGDPMHVSIFIGSVAMTERKPKKWVSLRQTLASINNLDTYFGKDFLCSLAAAMSVLDVYDEVVLQKVFHEKRIESSITRQLLAELDNVLLLYQAVAAFKPELSHLLPGDEYMKKIASLLSEDKDDSLEGCLHKILGGERYVKSDVRTKSFHRIDHVVLLRKGGYPVAINAPPAASKTYLEDIEVTPESQIVAILPLGPHHYTLNCRRLKGSTSLMMKTLEAKGCVVVPVCLELWTSLPEFERIPYLVEAIKLKSDYKESLSNFMS